MSELTLPGDIPGLLRLCSPVRTVPHGATGSQTFPSVVIFSGTAEDVDDEDDGPRPCADCGGFGHGPDTMQGDQHHNGPCPTCNGSGLATPFEDCGPGARRVTGRESASQEAWDRQAELLDGADLPDVEG